MNYLISFLILTLAMVAASAEPSLGTGDLTPAEKEDGAAQDLEEQFQSNEDFKSLMEKQITRMDFQTQNYIDLARKSRKSKNQLNAELFSALAEKTRAQARRFQKLLDSSQ